MVVKVLRKVQHPYRSSLPYIQARLLARQVAWGQFVDRVTK